MKVYDCIFYDGELNALLRRLRELANDVDAFLIVESTRTEAGASKPLYLRSQWSRVRRFAHRIRYIVVDVDPEIDLRADPVASWRDAVLRGLLDASDTDIVLSTDLTEVPSGSAIRSLRELPEDREVLDLKARPIGRGTAFRKSMVGAAAADQLLSGVGKRSTPEKRARRWQRRRRWILPDRRPSAVAPRSKPVIICPYLHDEDRAKVAEAFGLDSTAGSRLPFYFWKDEGRIGPERAFEHCWNQFPDRDVIIIHTDMRPLPSDCGTDWYDQLLAHVDRLPAAAIVACDLLYPVQTPSGGYYAQCAGGTLSDGAIDFIGGGVDTPSGAVDPSRAVVYGPQFRNVRRAQWVTFGGIYIRRELLDMVGNFDPQYEWAYVMDVDYCLEALVRGQDCYQVPVNLLHEENGTTRSFLAQAEYHQKVLANVERFKTKWAWLLSSM